MAYNLKSLEDRNVVAVVGAGHKSGIQTFLENSDTIPDIETLNYVKESRFSITKIIIYLIPIIFVLIFIIAFFQGINIYPRNQTHAYYRDDSQSDKTLQTP